MDFQVRNEEKAKNMLGLDIDMVSLYVYQAYPFWKFQFKIIFWSNFFKGIVCERIVFMKFCYWLRKNI